MATTAFFSPAFGYLKVLFPELYKRRDKENSTDFILWLNDMYYETSPRIEALQKAIIEVKRKLKNNDTTKQMA